MFVRLKLLLLLLFVGFSSAACIELSGSLNGFSGVGSVCYFKSFSGPGTLQVWSEEGVFVDVSCLGEGGSDVSGLIGGGECVFGVDEGVGYTVKLNFIPVVYSQSAGVCSAGESQCVNGVRWVCFGSSEGTVLLRDGSCVGTELPCAEDKLRCFHGVTYQCQGNLGWKQFGSGCVGGNGETYDMGQWVSFQHGLNAVSDDHEKQNKEAADLLTQKERTEVRGNVPVDFLGMWAPGEMCYAPVYNYDEGVCESSFGYEDKSLTQKLGYGSFGGISQGWSNCDYESLRALREYTENFDVSVKSSITNEEEDLFQMWVMSVEPAEECNSLQSAIDTMNRQQLDEKNRAYYTTSTTAYGTTLENGEFQQIQLWEARGPSERDISSLSDCQDCQKLFDRVSREFYYLNYPNERLFEVLDDFSLAMTAVEVGSGAACAGTWWAAGGACWVTGGAAVLELGADIIAGGGRMGISLIDGDVSRFGTNAVFTGVAVLPFVSGGVVKKLFGVIDELPIFARKIGVPETAVRKFFQELAENSDQAKRFTKLIDDSGPEAAEAIIEVVTKHGTHLDDAMNTLTKHGDEGLDLLKKGVSSQGLDEVGDVLDELKRTRPTKIGDVNEAATRLDLQSRYTSKGYDIIEEPTFMKNGQEFAKPDFMVVKPDGSVVEIVEVKTNKIAPLSELSNTAKTGQFDRAEQAIREGIQPSKTSKSLKLDNTAKVSYGPLDGNSGYVRKNILKNDELHDIASVFRAS